MPTNGVRQIIGFVRAFGIIAGLRLWCALFMQYYVLRREDFDLRVPGTVAPIYLRRRDLPIFWQIMIMQEYDLASLPQTTELLKEYQAVLLEGRRPLIVDCGGHIGLSAVWFATHFPEALIYVIEPDLSNFDLLRRNTAQYAQVIPLHGGVWNQPCRLMISNPLAGNASFRLQKIHEGMKVPQCKMLQGFNIEGVCPPRDVCSLFIVKIDIEGAEGELFHGPVEWLHNAKLVIIELHDWLLPWHGTSRSFFKKLAENSFDVVLRGENLLCFNSELFSSHLREETDRTASASEPVASV